MFGLTTLGYALSIAAFAGAVEWQGPKPTPVNQLLMEEFGWTPKPTEEPKIRGRKAGSELFARTESSPSGLCGYVSGIQTSSVTCPSFLDTCYFNTVIKAVGCCTAASDPPESCAQFTSCVDYSTASSCTGACLTNSLIVKCDYTSQFCQTFQWTLGYRALGCGTSAFSQFVELTSNNLIAPTATPTPTTTPPSSSSTTSSSSSHPASSSAPPNPGPVTNVGAIAGGVVGGLAVVAGFILALVFILRKKKKTKEVAAAASHPPMQQQPPDTGTYNPMMQPPMSPSSQSNPQYSAYHDTATAPGKPEYQYGQPMQYYSPMGPPPMGPPPMGSPNPGQMGYVSELPFETAPQRYPQPTGPIYEAPSHP